jgi:TPR repeat protein
VTQNYQEAVKWFRKAAEQGDANAQQALKELGAE